MGPKMNMSLMLRVESYDLPFPRFVCGENSLVKLKNKQHGLENIKDLWEVFCGFIQYYKYLGVLCWIWEHYSMQHFIG